MACWKRQAGDVGNDELPISVSYCWNQEKECSVHWKHELLNGQVLAVLTACESGRSSSHIDTNFCAESLKTWGIQMTADEWRNLIQHAVLEPEVRKYMFYNSRAFGITVAVVFYVTLWVNLYSILQLYPFAQYWELALLVTAVALVTALVVRLIVHRQQHKINMNTDIRLAAANEVFMKNQLLVGVTDILDKHCSIPQLWFVHFNVEPCLQSLANSITEMKRKQEAALRHNLDNICIVIETPVLPSLEGEVEGSLEDSPLLPNENHSGKSRRGGLTCRELLQLIPNGAPEARPGRELLEVFVSFPSKHAASKTSKAWSGPSSEARFPLCVCEEVYSFFLWDLWRTWNTETPWLRETTPCWTLVQSMPLQKALRA
ncbi:transmembrane protein 268 isoform X2 [Hemicordylus capensis]|uniref:transmembrane protein 268 isoform X2 n=1 Tax=Hemicordylus capensis TaxID=884348 RepID=UPI002302063C|nr:transmembrane protein 268 isoform X2 [Hemicordylus capensis]